MGTSPPIDSWANNARSPQGCVTRHFSITPSDTLYLDKLPLYIVALTDGNMVIEDETGVIVTYPVGAGQVLPFRPWRVRAATTATLVGWY